MWPLEGILQGVFAVSALVGLSTLVMVPVNVVRYNRYLSDNYSYTHNIGVGWCTGCTIAFFLVLVLYEVCFYRPTWMSELSYDTSLVVVWNVVCLKSRRHRVVVDMMAAGSESAAPIAPATPATVAPTEAVTADPDVDATEVVPTEQSDVTPTVATQEQAPEPSKPTADTDQALHDFITAALERCMEREKLYLNARLSLSDLAAAVGTNKTYISTYLNGQGCTFYDFINRYRVEEACRIIDQMATDGRIPMTDVAVRSGFNSISSFNRYFFRVKGVTPTAYFHRS